MIHSNGYSFNFFEPMRSKKYTLVHFDLIDLLRFGGAIECQMQRLNQNTDEVPAKFEELRSLCNRRDPATIKDFTDFDSHFLTFEMGGNFYDFFSKIILDVEDIN